MANFSNQPGLIVTRTPLRVSFAGGGTDLPDFYETHGGAVLSATINKYVYVTVKRHGELFKQFRLNYSETEQVDELDEIKNDIARECLRYLKILPPIYISTVADLPASSGLGSSSSFAVGLLNALHAYRGERVTAGQLAHEACEIEIGALRHPIGKQDQYAAAFGGLNFFSFEPSGAVTLELQHQNDDVLKTLFEWIMMFWTSMERSANSVLFEQKRNIDSKVAELTAMREHAQRLRKLLRQRFDPVEFGEVLDETWRLKRELVGGITTEQIDVWYRGALEAGAIGGKLCGAGGGGFLLFIVKPSRQGAVRRALLDMREIHVGYESEGSRLLFPSLE